MLAVVATVVASVFAQTTSVRWAQHRRTHEGVWTVALALFALASVCLFLGSTTGWDPGVYKAFYLLGAALNVPWLALGTIYLLTDRRIADRIRAGVVFFSGLATGAVLVSPLRGTLPTDAIPNGRDHFGALPRICVAMGSGLGAVVLFVGAAVSAWRWLRRRDDAGATRLAAANGCIALGTLVLSSGGLAKRFFSIDADQAFALCTALGISVIYAGFWIAAAAPAVGATRSRSGHRIAQRATEDLAGEGLR